MFIVFALSKDKNMVTRKLTELEAEFIDVIRNYKKAYPNGSRELEWYIDILYYSQEIEKGLPRPQKRRGGFTLN